MRNKCRCREQVGPNSVRAGGREKHPATCPVSSKQYRHAAAGTVVKVKAKEAIEEECTPPPPPTPPHCSGSFVALYQTNHLAAPSCSADCLECMSLCIHTILPQSESSRYWHLPKKLLQMKSLHRIMSSYNIEAAQQKQ